MLRTEAEEGLLPCAGRSLARAAAIASLTPLVSLPAHTPVFRHVAFERVHIVAVDDHSCVGELQLNVWRLGSTSDAIGLQVLLGHFTCRAWSRPGVVGVALRGWAHDTSWKWLANCNMCTCRHQPTAKPELINRLHCWSSQAAMLGATHFRQLCSIS